MQKERIGHKNSQYLNSGSLNKTEISEENIHIKISDIKRKHNDIKRIAINRFAVSFLSLTINTIVSYFPVTITVSTPVIAVIVAKTPKSAGANKRVNTG